MDPLWEDDANSFLDSVADDVIIIWTIQSSRSTKGSKDSIALELAPSVEKDNIATRPQKYRNKRFLHTLETEINDAASKDSSKQCLHLDSKKMHVIYHK